MNEKVFHVDIISPKSLVYSGPAVSLAAPGELGSFGVLAGHAPLLSKLIPGVLLLKEPSGQILRFRSKAKGFLEVLKNEVKVLVDEAEPIPG